MDIGGHRFFSKSDRVMQWWMDLMPPEVDAATPESSAPEISYQGKRRKVTVPAHLTEEPPLRGLGPLQHEAEQDDDAEPEDDAEAAETLEVPAPDDPDLVMLIRPRKSRIYYLRKFFDYPIKLTAGTLENLGIARTVRVGISYMKSRVTQIQPEKSLEDFLINRFGRELYLTFFKSYTEKVWGTPCDQISAEWGAQRIKGLSLTTAVKHFLRKTFSRRKAATGDLAQKGTDTSLIERFMYPKFGPGQLWEHVADQVVAKGGEIHMNLKVDAIHCEAGRVVSIDAVNDAGEHRTFTGDYFFSTMPMKDLVRALDAPVPANVREVSEGLEYRDFITVGLLASKLNIFEKDGAQLKDNWIYIQEPDVTVGRLQIFNNWSPWLVKSQEKVWIGLEYFCNESDPLWKLSDDEMAKFAIAEISKIGILKAEDVEDSHVVHVPKTYPAYFGSYDRFDTIREFTDGFENLFLVGRNGMHKYNNQDHSMLTAMTAVENIVNGVATKDNIWAINTEAEYHEEKAEK